MAALAWWSDSKLSGLATNYSSVTHNSLLNRVTRADPTRSGWSAADLANNPAQVEEVARYTDITKDSLMS